MKSNHTGFTAALATEIERQKNGINVRAHRQARVRDVVSGSFRATRTSHSLGGKVLLHIDDGMPVDSVEGPELTAATGSRARAADRQQCLDALHHSREFGTRPMDGSLLWEQSFAVDMPVFVPPDAIPDPESVSGLQSDPPADNAALAGQPSMAAPVDQTLAPVQNDPASNNQQPHLTTQPPHLTTQPPKGITQQPHIIAQPPQGITQQAENPDNMQAVLAPGGASDAQEAEALLQQLLAESASHSTMAADNEKLGRQLGSMASEAKRLSQQRAENTPDDAWNEPSASDEDADDASPRSAAPQSLGHDFFDRMGDRLGEQTRFSNTFNAGSFDLSDRLRSFEQELDTPSTQSAHTAQSARSSQSTSMTDNELVRELSMIKSASAQVDSVPSPTDDSATALPAVERASASPLVEAAPEVQSPVTPSTPAASSPVNDAAPAAPSPVTEKTAATLMPANVIVAEDGLSASAAAAATLVAELHRLPMQALDVVMRRAGWSAYEGTPPNSLLDAAEHFGLQIGSGDVARDPDALMNVLHTHGMVALGSADDAALVRLVAPAPVNVNQPGERSLFVMSVNGASAAKGQVMSHRELLQVFHAARGAAPLVLAYA